ncbi:MAG: lactate utilization protein C [Burkholderiales bacterium]|nr:lactate utilization protein C [Burkholderiales bacterium]
MSARDQILGRLRAAPDGGPATVPDVSGWYERQRRDEDRAQRIERLRQGLLAWRTEVHAVTRDNWTRVLLGLIAAKGLRQLLIGHDTPHGETLAASAPASLEIVRYEQAVEAWKHRLFDRVDASLTLARSAIAETGSLVLWPSASEPRLMSLVPAVHIVLLDVDAIHADFHAAIGAEGWSNGLPSNALLISGPSKTADIQQTLAYGAHGPRELVVLLREAEGVEP